MPKFCWAQRAISLNNQFCPIRQKRHPFLQPNIRTNRGAAEGQTNFHLPHWWPCVSYLWICVDPFVVVVVDVLGKFRSGDYIYSLVCGTYDTINCNQCTWWFFCSGCRCVRLKKPNSSMENSSFYRYHSSKSLLKRGIHTSTIFPKWQRGTFRILRGCISMHAALQAKLQAPIDIIQCHSIILNMRTFHF